MRQISSNIYVPVTITKGLSATLLAGPRLLGPRNELDSTALLHKIQPGDFELQKCKTFPWISEKFNGK